ncbi:MAG: N-acetylmuramoyl-L-alanine amidase [Alphaproteobacteria bacterium]|nr:N-acetylmuramoyl-L-alanine amidase [Alphaproteobacteria bacterium]
MPAEAPPAEAPPPVEAPPAEPEAPEIVDRPLPNAERRLALSQEYWRVHYGEPPEPLAITPRVVVLHWTVTDTADAAWNTFAPAELGGRPELGGGVNVSAHFLVDQDGTIYRLLPDTAMARHVIGLNPVAIGVENVGGTPAHPLTEAQVQADAALVRWLAGRYDITHLIGHLEYRSFEGHPYWAELDPDYRTTKPDPGADFMRQVRQEVSDLGLEGPPG